MRHVRLAVIGVVVVSSCALAREAHAQADRPQVPAADTGVYGRTPDELRPYARFTDPYKTFFLKDLEYPGYGRHIPEPDGLTTVKIGLVGPIIGTVSESIGGPDAVTLRVNERQARWDGYSASYLAPIGIKMLQGAQLAVQEANARGGYRGRLPYELVVRNDNGNWRSAGREVIMLAYQDSVWAIVGTVDGANTHIAIRAALKAELPIINTADTDPTLVETNIPWVFRNITDDRQMGYLLAEFTFRRLGLKRVAALRAVNRYGRMNIDEFRDAATRLGHPLVVELSYEEGDTLFTGQLEQIRSMNVDAIVTYGNVRESALILRQMRQLGMQQWFLGSDRVVTEEFIATAGPNPGKVAAGYPYNPTSENPRYRAFVQAFTEAYGEAPETYAAHAYDGMMMLIDAIEHAGLNRALIRDSLAAVKRYEGVTGTQEYDAVFSDRSPAALAVLEGGEWAFYAEDAMPAPRPAGVLDTPVEFGGSRGIEQSPEDFADIRIGLFAPSSSPMAAGVALAVEHVNSSGGVRGVPVRVVTRWSDDPWRGGASDMVRLAYDDSVWVVLGAVGGDATHIAEQVATKAWVPLVAPASTDPTLTYIRIPWMFRLPPHDEVQARVLMDGITTRALTDVGMITSSDHDGRTFADAVWGAASASGTTMVFHFEVPPGDDLVAVARRAGAFRPGALIVRTSPSSLPTLLEGLVDAGVDVPLLIPWVPGLNPDLITRIYPGAVLAVQPFDERLNPAYAEFRRAYRARHESDPPSEAAYGYDAVRLVVSALEVSGLNRAALRDAIAAADFTGVTGPVAWDNAGGNRAKPVLLTVSGRMNHGGSPQGVGSARR